MSRFDDPLQLLQADLKDDDYTVVMRSVNRLATIGLAMGQARCRSELIPFLREYVEDDNDEAHCAIARQLGDFAGLVGGANTAHVAALLPILEGFVAEEETVIRTAGVASISKLMPSLLVEHRASQLFPMIKRLSGGDWFTSRCSACRLTVSAYKLCNTGDLQTQMRTWFINLCHDDTPMVQTAAFQCLADLSVEVDTKHFLAELLPVLREIAQNDMDHLRIYAIDICAAVADVLTNEEYKAEIVPILTDSLLDDNSWRVRSRLAEKVPGIVKSLNAKNNQALVESTILPLFATLLADRETEVKLHTTGRLVEVASNVQGSSALVEHLAPALDALSSDTEKNIRLAFAKTLVPLCNAFPRDAAAKLLVPLMQAMANDDEYSVRHSVVTDLQLITDSGPNGILQQLVPQLLVLAKDPKWRVRMTVISKCALLAQALGQRMFERKLQEILIVSLSDHVSAIREMACAQSAKIVALFGCPWAAERFFPTAFSIYDPNTNYLHRMTCLLFIGGVADEKKATGSCFETTFLDLICQAFNDEVANVRLMACQTLHKMLDRLDASTIASRITAPLRTLAADTDGDVSYFASVCQKALQTS